MLQSLLDIIYNGSIEASLDMIRRLLVLAHSLYISVPVSEQLITMLGLELPPQPPLPSTAAHSKTNMEIPGMPQKSFQSHSMRSKVKMQTEDHCLTHSDIAYCQLNNVYFLFQ